MIDLRRLKSLTVLAEELHFGRAAERLGIAQPALTQQIQALERDIGIQLFVRTKRSVKLTMAGQAMVSEAIKTLQQAERTVLVAKQAGRGQLGHIEIGFVGSAVFSGILASAIANYREANPLVEFRLTELAILTQLSDIESGRLDLGIVRLPAKPASSELTISAIYQDPIILAVPAGHALAMSKSVRVDRLQREHFVAVQSQEGVGFNAQVAVLCAKAGFSPQIAQRAGQFTALAGMVAGGLGLAFVPSSVRNLKIPGVAYRPLDISQQSILAMVYRKSERSAAVMSFIKELRLAGKLATPA